MIVKEGPTGVYRLESFGRGVVAGFHSRIFDHSRRGEFLHKLGLFPDNLVMVKQVHGSTIVVAERPDPELLEIPADGLITKIPGLVLGIRTADCVPVFFWDPVRKVAGIVHAGWKGVKDGIIAQMLKIFEKKCGTKMGDLRVAIGPSIRKCCYEVGKEFLGYFPGFYHGKDAAVGNLDLVGVIKSRLLKRGIPESHVDDTGLCTVCENKKFFSYRMESQTQERILSVISII
ncbi:MAG: peptidoglycan editing factor PgeF [Candidatus Omnitrophota bacterium]